MTDQFTDRICNRTAASLEKLARLRGVDAKVVWDGAEYLANDTKCGTSVHGVYEWLERQPKVKT